MGCFSELMRREGNFLVYVIPTWLLSIIQTGLTFISLIFAGQLGEKVLAGVGLGNTMYNVMLWSILWGFTSVMDTFGPQVYGNEETKRELGNLTVKFLTQGILIYLVILGPFLNSVYLIRLLPDDTSHLAPDNTTTSGSDYDNLTAPQITVLYMRLICLVPLLDYCISILSKYLTIQKFILDVYAISFIMILLHVVLNLVLVKGWGMGVEGLALAALLGRVIALLVLLLNAFIKRRHLQWTGLSCTATFSQWREPLSLGISGAMNAFVELGMFEVATFLSQFNGINTLATVVALFQYIICFYTIPTGQSTAAAILIGNALSQQNIREVKEYMKITILNSLLESIPLALFFYIFRWELGGIFIKNEQVLEVFTGVIWIFLIQLPFDHLQTVLSRGILIAFGKQHFIALSLALSCYLLGTPIIAVLIFTTSLGPASVLLGFLAFAVVNTISCTVKIASLDIREELHATMERIESGKARSSTSSFDESTPLQRDDRADKGMTPKTGFYLFGGASILLTLFIVTSFIKG